MTSKNIPSGLPDYIINALSVFTDDELESIYACFSDDTNEFEGIGFTGPDGKFTKFANPEKAKAIDILEDEYRQELQRLNTERGFCLFYP